MLQWPLLVDFSLNEDFSSITRDLYVHLKICFITFIFCTTEMMNMKNVAIIKKFGQGFYLFE